MRWGNGTPWVPRSGTLTDMHRLYTPACGAAVEVSMAQFAPDASAGE
jgi:hypothetical protein